MHAVDIKGFSSLPRIYGENAPTPDPTEGKVNWSLFRSEQTEKFRQRKLDRRACLGKVNSQEYDEKYGRKWFEKKKETFAPKIYSSIGKHARNPKLWRTIRRNLQGPNFRKLLRDPYRKRWPEADKITVAHFAEFCIKDFKRRTLLETAATLPLDGVGCKFWRANKPDAPEDRGDYFVASSAEIRQRPIRGILRGMQYYGGRPARDNIAPVAKSLGSWRYALPDNAHPTVYRPLFPSMLAEKRTQMSTDGADDTTE